MCYVLVEHDNWTADTGYMCEDTEGDCLKTELSDALGQKVSEITAAIREHPNLIKAVNQSLMKELHLSINLTPPKAAEENASLDW